MFGAYFGLAASYILGRPAKGTDGEVNIVSDILSMIGTIFLWIYWPSFNGKLVEANSDMQQRAVVHTILSLCAATLSTFAVSTFLNPKHRFRPVDIQNATLAGGVAIGATCDLTMNPVDPLIIGMVAGCLSAYGFARITPILESYGVHDTCGINNLHGMPSFVGGLASVFITAYKGPRGSDMPNVINYKGQGGIQLGAICITLIIAVSAGIFTGLIMRKYATVREIENFSDEPYWDVEADGAHGEDGPEGEKPVEGAVSMKSTIGASAKSAAGTTAGDELEQGSPIGGPGFITSSKYGKVQRDSEDPDVGSELETKHVKL
jgi:ammonium transporter Rh